MPYVKIHLPRVHILAPSRYYPGCFVVPGGCTIGVNSRFTHIADEVTCAKCKRKLKDLAAGAKSDR